MESFDVAELTGIAGLAVLETASVLHRPEPLVVRTSASTDESVLAEAAETLRHFPTVTLVVGDPVRTPPALVDAVDLCLTDRPSPPRPWVEADPSALEAAVARHPKAALALVALLRTTEHLDVWSAIAAEAATYAMLLGSDDHQGWLRTRGPVQPRTHDRPPVHVHRADSHLTITLDRPEARNAIDSTTRNSLADALALPLHDPTITTVELTGNGPDFGAGGDLHEFGSTTDPATTHAVRLTCHPGWATYRVADRLTAHLHGHCIGAGIEIPAFAHRVTARPDTTIVLPELHLGLVPGAGGTASLPRRIGRHRTAWLALTGHAIDAPTAHTWGLVDDVLIAEAGDRPAEVPGSAGDRRHRGR